MFKPALSQRADGAQRDEVLPREDGSWRIAGCQQVKGGTLGQLDGREVLPNQLGIVADPLHQEPLAVASMAFLRRPDRARVSQKGDAPVTMRRQVAHGVANPGPVV